MTTETARDLIRSVMELPELLEAIDDDADLRMAGIDSGELILVALRCEQQLGRPLDESELSGLVSVRSVASILTGPGGSDGAA
ncbi:MAG TPA: acyl carrier protein [Actinocrinis sp.]|uniref:acyl carrier protein n=1 Tax=Actinocrinis sp. TaxID=1920516 RepID=UPI002DDC9893|nr:acyl carrier protein [Actinocrinis sp.]HEV2343027.1 acyl carrier protein [Actinocrinis sp.]